MVREAIEACIKGQGIDRARFFEAPKPSYEGILGSIERAFVEHGGSIHWANMGFYKKGLPCRYVNVSNNPLWYRGLAEIIPEPEKPVYALFEDSKNYSPKYWVYEAFLPELAVVLDEAEGLSDFYIVSKKYKWLISENHEETVSLVGEGLSL